MFYYVFIIDNFIDVLGVQMMEDILSEIQLSANYENMAFIKAREEEDKLKNEQAKGKEWQARMMALHKSWDSTKRDKFLNAKLRHRGKFHNSCAICKKVGGVLVCCQDCKQHMCWQCDHQFHFYNPLNARLFKGSDDFKSDQLNSWMR